jgi:UDP-N-acetylmuramate dehydrogenase
MQRRPNVPLAPLTTLEIGGPARELVEAESERDVEEAVLDAERRGAPLLVMGGGSNLVLADEGFSGTVLRLGMRGVSVSKAGDRVSLDVAAGEPWDAFVERCVEEELSGVECLSGIPGLVGATPIQNVGAYGQEVCQTITSVRVFDRARRAFEDMSPEACRFSYRRSVFKNDDRWIVVRVRFTFERDAMSRPLRYAELNKALGIEEGGRAPLAEVRRTILALRRKKGMVLDPQDSDTRSVGSFFVNPVVEATDVARVSGRAPDAAMPRFPEPGGRTKLSAAWLIERAGISKGHALGRAAVSSKHALALVNRGGASAREILELAATVRDAVYERFGVELTPEPVIMGLTGRTTLAPPRARSRC